MGLASASEHRGTGRRRPAPLQGSFTRVPAGVGPPVKPLTLAILASGRLTGSVRAAEQIANPTATPEYGAYKP